MKEFPPFRLDLANQCLWRRSEKREKEERILLTPKAFGVLRHLVEHAGRLVTHDELLDAVWPATHVQPQAIKKLILDLRSVLGDSAGKPVFIETLHRRGYRFIADVNEGHGPEVAIAAQPERGRLVGRKQALGELRQCLARASSGVRQVVFITGEPGIGKTALADEFQRLAAAEVTGIRIARGQCIEGYGGKEAYYPMLEALSELCRGPRGESVVQTLAAQAPTWLVQFPALVRREHRETLQREILGATRERMLREIGDALETIAAASPLLLVFEDVQWVDHSTVDLISALARRRAQAKLMLIATKRPLDMVLPQPPLKTVKEDLLLHQLCREIVLEPLVEAEVAEYLAGASPPAALPDGLAKLVYHHTEGNPLFMVAALEHMTERGLVSRDDTGWKLRVPLQEIALEVPHKLRRMIEAQIDRLTPEEQRALEVASVSGTSFSAVISARAANLDPGHFEELCERRSRRHHIIRSVETQRLQDGTASQIFEFVHALYREVLYRRQLPGPRANLHQRVGEQLEVLFPDSAPELAHHFEQASDWTRAVKYLRLAAGTARMRYVNQEAATILQRALELSKRLPEAERGGEMEILEKLGMLYALNHDTRAIENFEGMASRAARLGLIEVEARALTGLAYALSLISSERCLDVLERALALSDRQSVPLLRARFRMDCFFYRIWAGGWNARDAGECRNALNDIRKVGDAVTLSYHQAMYGCLEWASSEYHQANRHLSEAVSNLFGKFEENYLNLGLAFWVHALFAPSSLLFLGKWGDALRGFRAGIAALDKNGDVYRANTLRLYLAWVHLQAMDFETVMKLCEFSFPHPENYALGEESGSSGPLPEEARICLILKGSAQLALGAFDLALRDLLTARDAMDQQMVLIDWYWRMPLQSGLTEVWLAKGDLAQARTEAAKFLEVTMATAERTWQALAYEVNARVAMALGDLARAEDCIAKALSTMQGFEVPLADWRVNATAAEIYQCQHKGELAQPHRELSRGTILKLADSLAQEEPLRKIFLSAPWVGKVLGEVEATDTAHRRRGVKRAAKST